MLVWGWGPPGDPAAVGAQSLHGWVGTAGFVGSCWWLGLMKAVKGAGINE